MDAATRAALALLLLPCLAAAEDGPRFPTSAVVFPADRRKTKPEAPQSAPTGGMRRQSVVMKAPAAPPPPAAVAPAPVIVLVPSPARQRRAAVRRPRRRTWYRGAWIWEEAPLPEPAPELFVARPFHPPVLPAASSLELRDSVASEKPAPTVRRYVSDDGTRMITVSGERRKAALFDVAGIGEPVWLADLGAGVENAAFVQNAEDAPPRIILFLPDDAMKRFDSDGNPQI